MALIVKIMCANRGNDAHPRHGHRLFAGVQEVEFEETDRENRTLPVIHMTFTRETEATPEVTTTVALRGNVYVMNEAGKTISMFEVDPVCSEVEGHPRQTVTRI